MKNKMKFLGIIALAAVIGLGFFASCGEAEDPEMKITITGLSEYSGKYGAVGLVTPANLMAFWTGSADPVGESNVTSISSSTTFALLDASGSPLVNKSGTYVVILLIAADQAGDNIIFVGATAIGGTSIGNSTTSIAFSDIDDYTAFLFGSSPDGTEANPYPLTAGEWSWDEENDDDFYVTAVGTTSSDLTTGAIWFSFDVTGGVVYNVFWDDAYAEASGQCDADICVAAKYEGSSSWIFGGPGQQGNSSSNRGVDTAYTVAAIGADKGGRTFTPTTNGTVLLRVLAETALVGGVRSGAVPGSFAIVYTTGTGAGAIPRITFPVGNVLQGIKY